MRKQLSAEVGGRVARCLPVPRVPLLLRLLDDLAAQHGVGLPPGPVLTLAQDLDNGRGQTGGQYRMLEADNKENITKKYLLKSSKVLSTVPSTKVLSTVLSTKVLSTVTSLHHKY